ncbi:hypothetical protein NHX12_033626 [Muraenolepis orangiensis]|uniref:Uncharacterized protein n=1 Tax=Muraenolepis orangiensis TaxID=630683 RepID=A0A9Q0E303_9TELE|nr:hypothetical protein NHX12_033626 [Muraenolepis orangiensis]
MTPPAFSCPPPEPDPDQEAVRQQDGQRGGGGGKRWDEHEESSINPYPSSQNNLAFAHDPPPLPLATPTSSPPAPLADT